MADDRERPITASEEIERTGRDAQVAPDRLEAAGTRRETRTGLAEDDAPADGVDSADFPGAGAP